jgi:hypothetical protein
MSLPKARNADMASFRLMVLPFKGHITDEDIAKRIIAVSDNFHMFDWGDRFGEAEAECYDAILKLVNQASTELRLIKGGAA